MPRFNIFVRDEDMDLWNAIEDRPRWVHDALRGTGKEYPKVVIERKKLEKLILGREVPKKGVSSYIPKSKVWPNCPRHHVPLNLCRDKH